MLASWVILRGQLARRGAHLQVPHRRGEDRAAEMRAFEQGAQADAAAHGMRDHVARAGQRRDLGVRRAGPRRRAGSARKSSTWPRSRRRRMPVATGPGRASRSPRPRGRARRSRRATRPYFSTYSVRPGNTIAAPRAPPCPDRGAQPQAVRRRQPERPPAVAARRPRRRGTGAGSVIPAGCPASSRGPCRRRP